MKNSVDTTWKIRPARSSESLVLQDIEAAAGVQFRDIGMPEIAEDEPMSVERLTAYAEDGRSWVVVDIEGRLGGYAVVDELDGCAYLEQISVKPEHQGTGIGKALITEIEQWARGSGLSAITLSTFEHVPWNAPLYAHLGFRILDDQELTDGLRGVRQREADHGLDMETRVFMRREIA